MLADDLAVREYLRAPDDSFWEWRDNGEVVAWRDGRTIAFRGELVEVLGALAPRGLPPFSAILLLLAATRHAWTPRGLEAELLAAMLTRAEPTADRIRILKEGLAGLDRVRSLDVELRAPTTAKGALAEHVFENARGILRQHQADAVVEVLRLGTAETIAAGNTDVTTRGYGPVLLVRDLAALRDGLKRIDAEALRLRMATGLTSLPAPANVELPPATTASNLISSLTDDHELAGVGRVARRLLSSASLPRRLSAEPEQELGGYSDIANRGSLDRLLASELAHDNLTLAVRVAMNEALYLRRESPPSRPQQHRTVLIDSGIRTWGVPRVFAAAASLAMAATMSSRGSVSYYRARGEELEPVDLLSRQGIVDHLATLRPELNLADAIPAFVEDPSDDDRQMERVIVTSEDGLADAAVQEALRRAACPQLFLATVSRAGRFRMYERRLHGVKLLHEASLDLAELFAESPSPPVAEPTPLVELPAIFSAQPFPLYLPHQFQPERAWYASRWGALAVTNDRRLMLWAGRTRGGRQMTDRLPAGRVWWTSPVDAADCMSMVLGPAAKLQLVRIDRDGKHMDCRPLVCDPPATVCAHNGVLFMVSRRQISVVSMESGATLQTVEATLGLNWRMQRFFHRASGSWYALSYDGHGARFDLVRPADGSGMPRLIAMFDSEGADGPVGVTEAGAIYNTARGVEQRVPHGLQGELRVTWVAADGRRLQIAQVVPVNNRHPTVMVDVERLTATPCNPPCFDDRVQASVHLPTIRHRFSAVGVTDLGALALRSGRGQIVEFVVRHGLPQFTLAPAGRQLRYPRKFEPMECEAVGCRLASARWDDGSECILDSRGLLHLRPADRAIPEATLVLSEGELSGWSSDGHAWGRMYFVSAGPHVLASTQAQAEQFAATVRRFVACIHA